MLYKNKPITVQYLLGVYTGEIPDETPLVEILENITDITPKDLFQLTNNDYLKTFSGFLNVRLPVETEKFLATKLRTPKISNPQLDNYRKYRLNLQSCKQEGGYLLGCLTRRVSFIYTRVKIKLERFLELRVQTTIKALKYLFLTVFYLFKHLSRMG